MTLPLKLAELWPVKLVRRRLPDAAKPTDELRTLIHDQESREDDFTARYQEQNFFARTEPAVQWLKQNIDETVTSYLEHVGVDLAIRWSVEGWYNVNRLGDHHAPHGHPGAYLSGTYYVKVPTSRAQDLKLHAAARPGCISFYDPRSCANMLTRTGEPDSRSTHVVQPGPGTLMMWPSQLQHYVHPNLSHDERISISFNIILVQVAGGSGTHRRIAGHSPASGSP